MGSEIQKGYEVDLDTHQATGGHGLSWKLFNAVSKPKRKTDPPGKPVTIFLFDKDDLKQIDKKDHEALLKILRKDIKSMKTLHHPHCLRVIDTFDENRKMLGFVTERVFCSLANAFKDFRNLPFANVSSELRQFTLSPFELMYGISHLTEALSFLHKEANIAHLGISPESIFVMPDGRWKLGGFGFSASLQLGQKTDCPWYTNNQPQGGKRYTIEPDLSHAAPELTGGTHKYGHSADIFSLGVVAVEIQQPLNEDGSITPYLDVRDQNPATHQYKTQSLDPNPVRRLPDTMQQAVQMMLVPDPDSRLDAARFLTSPCFSAGPILTMKQLETIVSKDPGAQAQFLAGLPQLLAPFPAKVLRDQVLPHLMEVAKNLRVSNFVLPCILAVVAKIEPTDYQTMVAQPLIPLLSVEDPFQTAQIFLNGFGLLLEKSSQEYARTMLLPFLTRSLDR
jgi:SCY1-like protein 2